MSNHAANLGWPFVNLGDDVYVGVEVSPNEFVHVVMRHTYDSLQAAHQQLLFEHARLRDAAQAQIEAANAAIDLWRHYGHRHE